MHLFFPVSDREDAHEEISLRTGLQESLQGDEEVHSKSSFLTLKSQTHRDLNLKGSFGVSGLKAVILVESPLSRFFQIKYYAEPFL